MPCILAANKASYDNGEIVMQCEQWQEIALSVIFVCLLFATVYHPGKGGSSCHDTQK